MTAGACHPHHLLGAAQTGRCRFCGRRFTDEEPYLLGVTASDKPAAACQRCEHRLARSLLIGALKGGTAERELRAERAPAFITGPGDTLIYVAETAWKADDREWFARHPRRSHRCRAPFPDELPADMDGEVVIVRQLQPGARLRLVITAPPPAAIRDDEHGLHALFDLAAKAYRSGSEGVRRAELDQRIELMRHGGHA